MPTAIDNIVDGFLFPTILPIFGTPTYNTIAEVNLKLNSNAASVQSNLGCGTLWLLQLTVSPAVYNTVSTIAFIVTFNPNSTGAQILNFTMLPTPHLHSSTSTIAPTRLSGKFFSILLTKCPSASSDTSTSHTRRLSSDRRNYI